MIAQIGFSILLAGVMVYAWTEYRRAPVMLNTHPLRTARYSALCTRLINQQRFFYQLAKPIQDRKRSKHLEQYGSSEDYGHIANHPAQNPLR